MRKYIVLILFVILSCQPEELIVVEPMPQYEMIFEETSSYVIDGCLLYTSPSPRDRTRSRMPSSA